MSYNINAVHVIKLDAWFELEDYKRVYSKYLEDLPEINFLDELQTIKSNEKIFLTGFDWCGCFSGRSFNLLEKKIAPFIKGIVEAVFIWEDGTPSGIKIENGKLRECEVEYKLSE